MGHSVSVHTVAQIFRKISTLIPCFVRPVNSGVKGHFNHHPYGRGWVKIQDHVTPLLAELVGK